MSTQKLSVNSLAFQTLTLLKHVEIILKLQCDKWFVFPEV